MVNALGYEIDLGLAVKSTINYDFLSHIISLSLECECQPTAHSAGPSWVLGSPAVIH